VRSTGTRRWCRLYGGGELGGKQGRVRVSAGLSSVHTIFRAGDVVAGRFRVVAFLARGGTGEVYEAEDVLLHTRVALKTLRAHVADEPDVIERFRREILFARRVTHPNVCRVFDVFEHAAAGPRQPPVVVLTMELLQGETLADRLRRRGSLPPAEAEPVVAQVVAALAAAHEAGVIHRDLKSANVMLVPSADGAERVVVTDFGLARAVQAGEDASATAMAGTSAYMAPEQVEGGAITPAADVYALGVVMFEMVTGRRPFEGATPAVVALSRLQGPAPSPRSVAPGLDERWERTILRCLERNPRDRPAVGEVVGALAGPASPNERLTRGSPWVALLVVLVLGAGALLWLPRPQPAPAAVAGARRAVAVLGFKSLSGRPESAWLSVAIPQMLATELSSVGSVRVVPGENVAVMKVDLALSDAESLGPATLARIRAHSGADLVVLGSYVATGGEGAPLRIDLRLQDTGAGETLASFAETGTEAGLAALVAQGGSRLRALLQGGDEDRPALPRRAALPATPEAARAYAQGVQRMNLLDPRGAIAELEQAVRLDPHFAMALVRLSEAWSMLGYDAKAQEHARRALDAAGELGEEDRLLVEARYHQVAHEWDKAVERYRRLYDAAPDDVERGLRLLRCQIDGNLPAQGETTLAALRKLTLAAAERARLDLYEAELAQTTSDYPRARDAAGRAGKLGEEVGARLVAARARDLEAWSLQRLGRMDEALSTYEDARRAFIMTRDRSGLARVTSSIGLLLRLRGDVPAARRHHEEALAIFREVGDRWGTAWALQHLGIVAETEGHLGDARAAFQESLDTFREVADEPSTVLPLLRLGNLSLLGGEPESARLHYEESLRVSRKAGAKSQEASSLQGVGDVAMAMGDAAGARAAYEAALALRIQLQERARVAGSRFALGQLAFHEGDLEAAESATRQSAAEFAELKLDDPAATGWAMLARVLVARERLDEAGAALAAARRAWPAGRRGEPAIDVALAAAAVSVAQGDPSAARRVLAELATTVARLPLRALETEIALGQVELSSGDVSAGEERLRRARRDAERRGLRLLAATAARPSHGVRSAREAEPLSR
jgi:tetratricopeptide (TPR) repeat protein/tRNA A-37 threonylcarbamoyl transferase component Bud32